jgi:Uma2 family endonuclease
VLPEQRVQVSAQRFRIPDVCVLSEDAPHEKIVRTPPVLCIEILSKYDSMNEIMQRVDEYLEMGVGACWVVDPLRKRAWCSVTPGHIAQPADGVLRAGAIEMPLAEVVE